MDELYIIQINCIAVGFGMFNEATAFYRVVVPGRDIAGRNLFQNQNNCPCDLDRKYSFFEDAGSL
jgi:hypothetical protein